MDFINTRRQLLDCPAFEELSIDTKAKLLLLGEPRRYTARELVFRKGEHSATTLFLVVNGSLGVVSEVDGGVVASRGAGEIFGEIGIFNPDRERTATVIAEVETDVLMWDFSRMDPALRAVVSPPLQRLAFQRIASDLPG